MSGRDDDSWGFDWTDESPGIPVSPRPDPSDPAARSTPPAAGRRPDRAARRRAQLRRRRAALLAIVVAILVVLLVVILRACGSAGTPTSAATVTNVDSPAVNVPLTGDGIKLATFLGTGSRRFYGLGPAPQRLDVIWKTRIGGGWTEGKFQGDPKMYWSGTGWTGQPALVEDGGRLWLLIGGYDHKIHRIDAETGKIVWASDVGDVIKSSPSVVANPHPTSGDDRYLVLAGSRRGLGYPMGDPRIASYRAVTFGSGKEVWRLPVPRTQNYTQDVDASGFLLDGMDYIGIEPGWFYALDPFHTQPWSAGGQTHAKPVVVHSKLLIATGDVTPARTHKPDGANLALEASPSLLGDTVFVSSGAGHVYGMRASDLAVVYDYRTRSDMDGTPVTTRSGKLLVAIEKEYIPGHGGVMMLDPTRKGRRSPVWYFPTGDRQVAEWKGGVIGSAAVNDEYGGGDRYPPLAAFIGIDGWLHVVSQDTLAAGTVTGPDGHTRFRTPVEVWKGWLNAAVSTPIFSQDSLIAAGYDDKVHLYHIDYAPAAQGAAGALRSPDGHWWTVHFGERATFTGGSAFESTPVLWDGRVYIGCRDGYFYCLGDK